ncbi:A33 protein, partial [Amia calva]|nr:A33 protein [Amia calva]
MDLRSVGPHSPTRKPEPAMFLRRETEGPQDSSTEKVSLYKRISLLLACVWILTLISGLAVYFHHPATEKELQTENRAGLKREQEALQAEHSNLLREHSELLKNYKTVTDSHLLTERTNTELRKQLENKESEYNKLQGSYSSMKASYLPIEMCFSNDTSITGMFSEYSRKEGLVLKPVWKWLREAAVDVTLDPNTAEARLILSEDKKQVKYGDQRQALPDNRERFNPIVNVLGKEGFTSGRHYWEVEVGMKTEWDLGVAEESINRKGRISLAPENGYWTVWLRNGDEYRALEDDSIPLNLSLRPRKIGVFVDYEAGQVSFYNVEARSHIYTFIDTFTEKLYPFFSPTTYKTGRKYIPLIISPVSNTD